jgi:L-malate glycosyltransferase
MRSIDHRPTPRVAIVAASMRILGGHSVQAQRMLNGWADDPNVHAWLVPIDPLPPKPFDRLLPIRFVRTLVTQACYWPLLLRELRKASIVHVFSASYTSFLLAPLPAIVIAHLYGRPVVLNYHSGEAPDHLRRSRLARMVLSHAVALNVVPSSYLRDALASFGIHATVVPNAIDRQAFAYRARVPLRPRLLSTRNFEPHYNVACTLRAFARVQARCPEASLTLVGSGSQDRHLRDLSRALGLRNVIFAGAVAPADMPGYYASADIYVQTPSVDNMPLSMLEAFASGLPVVSTRVGGVPVLLTDGVHGLLAPDDDAGAVASQVLKLLDDPDAARAMAAAARATCSAYDWAAVREAWLTVYNAIPSPAAA